MKKLPKFLLLSILFFLIQACGSRKLPQDAVKIYDGQLDLLEGSYLINSYYSPSFSENLKGIDQFLGIDIPLPITYVNLKFKDEETMVLTYSLDGIYFEREFKGKLKRGAIYIASERRFLGIPLVFYISLNSYTRLIMGNEDNLILERYQMQITKGINSYDESYEWESYYYDRLYQDIHIDTDGKIITQ